jgi:hypothetical protein
MQGDSEVSYEKLKAALATAVQEHYQSGTPIIDIRAAIHAADLLAEQYAAIELMEIAKSLETAK